ncbi:alkaline phosphatase family protein [bacterium]|nr:alkaline phosphatase family protein [bacterium]
MKQSRKVLVIGLDGVPISLLRELIAHGLMPSLASIIQQTSLVEMQVSLPELSAVSWTSFMTGSNPGSHGIFGFTDLKPYSYELTFPLYSQIKVPTIWDRLGSLGKRSVIINQPATYPARRLEGAMVSGFVAVDLFKAVFPARYIRTLRKQKYLIDIDTEACRQDHSRLFDELALTLASRKFAVDLFWTTENWDYFELVITGTDRLHHYVWDAITDPDQPYHTSARNYYGEIDAFLGEIVERFQKKMGTKDIWDQLFILSDHGFCALEKEVYLNAWLKKEGYLFVNKDSLFSLASINPNTTAFALDPGRIYIHTKRQFPSGPVDDHQITDVVNRLKESLFRLEYNGIRVVNRIFDRDDLYSGPLKDQAPHLIIQTTKGFDFRGSFQEHEVFQDTDLKGMHMAHEAFCINRKVPSHGLHIEQLAQYILQNY